MAVGYTSAIGVLQLEVFLMYGSKGTFEFYSDSRVSLKIVKYHKVVNN